MKFKSRFDGIFLLVLLLTPLGSTAAENIRPEAVVVGKKSPIQITLRLYRKQARVDEYLWYQIELKNIGKNKIHIWDNLFASPSEMWENADTHSGVYIELISPDGKRENIHSKETGNDSVSIGSGATATPEEGKKIQPLVQKWKKEGLSFQSINLKLIEYERHKASEEMLRKSQDEPFWLMPGASTTTAVWISKESAAGLQHVTQREPIGQYAELDCYWLWRPGKYRLRAIYNHFVDMSSAKKYGRSPSPEHTLVKTPFIDIKVLPKTRDTKNREQRELQELINDARRRSNKELEKSYLDIQKERAKQIDQ